MPYSPQYWDFTKLGGGMSSGTNAIRAIPGSLNTINATANTSNALANAGASAASGTFANYAGGIGAGIGAAVSLGNLFLGIANSKKQNKLAQEQLNLAKQQFETENKRYAEREAERQKANENIAAAVGSYDLAQNPMARE